MVTLNLTAKKPEEIKIKNYLEKNASENLAEKINNGVRILKDGKTLINKKTIETFEKYAGGEAQKQAEKDARYIRIDDDVVYGWAIHYFEEDSIEGILFNEDGTQYEKPKPIVPKVNPVVVAPQKPKTATLFDLMEKQEHEPEFTEEEQDAALDELSKETEKEIVTEPAATVQKQLRGKIEVEYNHPNNNIIVCGIPPTNKPLPKTEITNEEQGSDIYDLSDF